jgi:hypothetical protein
VSEGTGGCPPFGGELAGAFWNGRVTASRGCGGALLARPYLENCTVDASIFFNEVYPVVFAKLLRAHGGCLGIRSR